MSAPVSPGTICAGYVHRRVVMITHKDKGVHVRKRTRTTNDPLLLQATDSLRENWGEYMTECTFNWRMLKTIFTELHVYDAEKNYKPFDWRKEEPMFALQRQVLPNSN